MAAKRKAYIKMQCPKCRRFTHFVHKSKTQVDAGAKLEIKKFCRFCKGHTVHKEAK